MTILPRFEHFEALLRSVKALRGTLGCQWHKKQTFKTLAPFTQTEVYELTDAIDQENPAEIKEELGDLLFHIALYAQHAEERGWFNFEDVAELANTKIIRRHPWVFDAAQKVEYSDAKWEEIKSAEKKKKPAEKDHLLSGLPSALPALLAAHEIHKRVNAVGFKWDDVAGLFAKINEEMAELKVELASNDTEKIEDELGDVLFSVAILGYYTDINPEKALRRANEKFKRRFNFVETRLKEQGLMLKPENFEPMEHAWQECKKQEKAC